MGQALSPVTRLQRGGFGCGYTAVAALYRFASEGDVGTPVSICASRLCLRP
jgi:hypothetical protein